MRADADQRGNADGIQAPDGGHADREQQKRVRKAQITPEDPHIEREKCDDEPDALIAGTFLLDQNLEIANTEQPLVDVEYDVGLVEAENAVRCL